MLNKLETSNSMGMTFEEFSDQYDRDGSVILLEGKREIPEKEKEKLVELGRLLALKTSRMTFRSGNAPGADYLFSLGTGEVAKERLQVIVPYSGHRKKSNLAGETVSIDDINLTEEPEAIYQSLQHRNTEKLVDRYLAGERNQYTVKAAYIIRDTLKVLGTADFRPASFAIFYDNPVHPRSGGTGHTMNVCDMNNIPYIDQKTWFDWF